MNPSDWRHFDRFRLNVRTGELRSGIGPVPLERQPARILTRLVANSGQLVSREDLRQAVWGDDTHVDFDRGLSYCVRQVRLALGDDARAPRFIETVPRQGYRFIAPLVAEDRCPIGEPRVRQAILALAAAVIVLVSFAVEAGPRNENHHRIAVAVVRSVHDFLF